jgi:hypothetical protein
VTKKSDRVAERLRKLIAEEASRKTASAVLMSAPKWWADPILERAEQLRDAVTLRTNEAALHLAFRAFDLDPHVPDHWHRLINYLARSHYEQKSPGAPKEWTAERQIQLLKDFRRAAKQLGTNNLLAIASLLREDASFDRSYARRTAKSLLRQIYSTIAWANSERKTR